MSYKHNLIKERFDVQITAENQTFKQEFELDKNANYLIGIALTSSRDDLMFYRGSQKILLNDMELFPEGFESKLLMSGLNVAPDNRLITLGELGTGNGKIEIAYTDKAHELIKFVPYRVTIYTFSVIETNSEY
ncbi:MAG: hypothetical protein HYR91_04175 [Flavobacteriia bacterium]|nr:hypothetical protein [Flavobacteriia bacterium]